jgi:hypothetical protein
MMQQVGAPSPQRAFFKALAASEVKLSASPFLFAPPMSLSTDAEPFVPSSPPPPNACEELERIVLQLVAAAGARNVKTSRAIENEVTDVSHCFSAA